jgi:lipopolysaccharide export system protein LptA
LRRRSRPLAPAAAVLLGLSGQPFAAAAQAPAAPEPPIEVQAETGIEWDRPKQIIIARGKARAVRGDLTVTADVLTAHYLPRDDGTIEVWRLDADGNVKIVSPSDTATADAATYDVTDGLLVLTRPRGGPRVRVVTSGGEVTADNRIDYARPTRVLVARGNAEAKQPEQRLQGDVITAHLREDGSGRARFEQVDAEGNVDVVTPDERIRAQRGRYDGPTDTAIFTGAVQIFRGESVLNGCRAEFDLATGFSKLLPCANATGDKARVRGVIMPSATGN